MAFVTTGGVKLITAVADLVAKGLTWADGVDPMLVKFIGLSELAGALGLILPSVLRIQPKLTPAAAVGLVVVMVLAAGTHIAMGEAPLVVGNIVLGGLAAFVAWGRSSKFPIAAK